MPGRVQVMQRGLPRPDALTALQEPPSLATLKDRPLEMAEALIQTELISLLHYEATKFPVKKKGKRKRGEPEDSVPLGPLGPWEEFSVRYPSSSFKTANTIHMQVKLTGHEKLAALSKLLSSRYKKY